MQNIKYQYLQGVISDILTEVFILQGILEKPILVGRTRATFFGQDQRLAYRELSAEEVKSCWEPEEHIRDTWRDAVTLFSEGMSLRSCVWNCLIPFDSDGSVQEYALQKKSLTEYMLERGILSGTIREYFGEISFFNASGVYCREPQDRLHRPPLWKRHGCMENVWSEVVEQFEPGMSLDQCMEFLLRYRPARWNPIHNCRKLLLLAMDNELKEMPLSVSFRNTLRVPHDNRRLSQQDIQELTENLPSFIDQQDWKEALTRFAPGLSFGKQLEQYYLAFVKDPDKLIQGAFHSFSLTEWAVEQGIIEQPIRVAEGKVFFFDRNQIYSASSKEEWEYPIPWGGPSLSQRAWQLASTRFRPGQTLEECMWLYVNTPTRPTQRLTFKKQYGYMERLVTRIDRPKYERETGNSKERTLDRIRVNAYLPRHMFETWGELTAAVRANRREISKMVVDKISSDYRFLKYGVPINVFQLTSMTICRDYSLEFIFELKIPCGQLS